MLGRQREKSVNNLSNVTWFLLFDGIHKREYQ